MSTEEVFERVKKIIMEQLGTVEASVTMEASFLDDLGTLQRKKIYFNYKKIGPGSSNYNENSKEIYIKLIEIQKVLDKGDF